MWAYITIGVMDVVSLYTVIYSYGIYSLRGFSTGG
jgi:hypothetical protein